MKTNELKHAFVLHTRPYRETSIIAELFTLEEGRVGVLAKGAKRRHSSLNCAQRQFTPLLVNYLGRGELQTLIHAEACDPGYYFSGTPLLSALYVNEILMRLLSRGGAVPEIFSLYEKIVHAIAKETQLAEKLRLFEKQLLVDLGYGLNLTTDYQTGKKIERDVFYRYNAEHGFFAVEPGLSNKSHVFSGASLMALGNEHFSNPSQLSDAKQLLRLAFAPLLGSRPIKTRELFQ